MGAQFSTGKNPPMEKTTPVSGGRPETGTGRGKARGRKIVPLFDEVLPSD